MSRRRFLVAPGSLDAGRVELDRAEAAHALKVLRLSVGDEVLLLDGEGRVAQAVLAEAAGRKVACRVTGVQTPEPPRPRLVLCVGLLKNPAMDLATVKLTELMVDEVRPFTSIRGVARPAGPAKTERWVRLARQALKQCGAPRPPEFFDPRPLDQVLAAAPASAARLLLYEDQKGVGLASALAQAADPAEVWVVVGPEGGFDPAEVAAAEQAGFTVCGLPGAVLRAETASLAAAAVVRFGRA